MSLHSFLRSRLRRTFSVENRAAQRFHSPEPIPHRSHWSIIKWMLTRRPRPYPSVAENARIPSFHVPVERGQWEAVMVNHATILIRLHGLNVLTDPVWSGRVSPVAWMGPKRKRPAGIAWEDLPQVDAVLVSHDHYDHVDAPTLKRLEERFHPIFLVPLGLRPLLLRHCGAQAQIRELDWWESVPLPSGDVEATVTFTPARHYSGRSPFHGDANRSLWGGFFLRAADGPGIYFAGDTARTRFSRKYGTASALRTWPSFPSGPIFRRSSWQASICRRSTQSGPLKRCAPGRAWPSTSAPGNWRTTATRKRWTISGKPFAGKAWRKHPSLPRTTGLRSHQMENPVPSRFHQNQIPRQNPKKESRQLEQQKASSRQNADHAGEHGHHRHET